MSWYVAHAILYFEADPASTDPISVLENVYLIEAEDEETARLKAEERGRAECGNAHGTLKYKGRPAELRYGGLRKLTTPIRRAEGMVRSPDIPNDSLEDGTEVTYSRLVVSSRQDLEALVAGQPVSVSYEE